MYIYIYILGTWITLVHCVCVTLLHVMQHLDLAGLIVKQTLFPVGAMLRYLCSLLCFCHVALSALPSLQDDTTCLAPEAEHLAFLRLSMFFFPCLSNIVLLAQEFASFFIHFHTFSLFFSCFIIFHHASTNGKLTSLQNGGFS